MRGLQAEDVQPVILLRTLQRELLTLLELTKPQLRNPSLNTSLPTQTLKADFDRLKIWQSRRPLYTAAIQRLTYQKLFEILQELADIERTTKQEYGQDVWVNWQTYRLNFVYKKISALTEIFIIAQFLNLDTDNFDSYSPNPYPLHLRAYLGLADASRYSLA